MNRQDYLKSVRLKQSICRHCGKAYIPKEATRTSYCSRDCYFASGKVGARPKEKSMTIKCCKICSMTLINKRTGYCGDICRKKYASQYDRERNKVKKELRERPCKECGNLFAPEYGNKRRGLCSNECSQKYHQRTAKATRRARQRGLNREPFNPYTIFNRDKWICQLCHIKTPRKLRGTNHDNAPELDHIMSLAQGGEHSMRNTQCLCRKCNQDKGAATRGQIRMFG